MVVTFTIYIYLHFVLHVFDRSLIKTPLKFMTVQFYVILAESVSILATSQAIQSFTITEPVLSNTLHLSHLANAAEAK